MSRYITPLLAGCVLALCSSSVALAQAPEAVKAPVAQTASAFHCMCQVFAYEFNRSPKLQRYFDRKAARQGVSRVNRKRVKRAIHDWEKNGDFKTPFCKKYKKVCKAAIACVSAAATSLIADHASVPPTERQLIRAGAACTAAVATVLLSMTA